MADPDTDPNAGDPADRGVSPYPPPVPSGPNRTVPRQTPAQDFGDRPAEPKPPMPPPTTIPGTPTLGS